MPLQALEPVRGDLTVPEARAIQQALRSRVETQDRLPSAIRTVAGVDLSHNRFSARVFASAVVLRFPTMELLEEAWAESEVTFPYVSGYLTFRELPPVLAALEKLTVDVDLIAADGHGYAHPRRIGIASHLGLALDVPSIGCAKSILVGRCAEPGPSFGDRSPLKDGEELLGYAVRTRPRAQPIYVDAGHRVSPETAVGLVLQCCRGYRLPEPTRQAHQLANRVRMAAQ